MPCSSFNRLQVVIQSWRLRPIHQPVDAPPPLCDQLLHCSMQRCRCEVVVRELLMGLYQLWTTSWWMFSVVSSSGFWYSVHVSRRTINYLDWCISWSVTCKACYTIQYAVLCSMLCYVCLISLIATRCQIRPLERQVGCLWSVTAGSKEYRSMPSSCLHHKVRFWEL